MSRFAPLIGTETKHSSQDQYSSSLGCERKKSLASAALMTFNAVKTVSTPPMSGGRFDLNFDMNEGLGIFTTGPSGGVGGAGSTVGIVAAVLSNSTGTLGATGASAALRKMSRRDNAGRRVGQISGGGALRVEHNRIGQRPDVLGRRLGRGSFFHHSESFHMPAVNRVVAGFDRRHIGVVLSARAGAHASSPGDRDRSSACFAAGASKARAASRLEWWS